MINLALFTGAIFVVCLYARLHIRIYIPYISIQLCKLKETQNY